MSGRTIWYSKDAAWWAREWIVDLGQEVGIAGPATIDYLEAQAKLQNDGGHVKSGFKSIARAIFSDAVTVCNAVSHAVTLGLLIDYEEDSGIFKCVISWWHADQERALGAERVARHRRRLSSAVTVGNGASRSVTNTEQDRTEELLPANAGSTRKRATRRVDQSTPPRDFPDSLRPTLDAVLVQLHATWDLRGGIEPQPRGVGLAIMRNPKADHAAVARRLQHWLTAGTGQRAACKDITARFGDWVADEPASTVAAPPKAQGRDFSRFDRIGEAA